MVWIYSDAQKTRYAVCTAGKGTKIIILLYYR